MIYTHKTAKNKNGHPWIDAELKNQIRRQQRLYKKMKNTGDPDIKLTGNTNITYKTHQTSILAIHRRNHNTR